MNKNEKEIYEHNIRARSKKDLLNGPGYKVMWEYFRSYRLLKRSTKYVIEKNYRWDGNGRYVDFRHTIIAERMKDDGTPLPVPNAKEEVTIPKVKALNMKTPCKPMVISLNEYGSGVVYVGTEEGMITKWGYDLCLFCEALSITGEPVSMTTNMGYEYYPIEIRGKYWRAVVAPRTEELDEECDEKVYVDMSWFKPRPPINLYTLKQWLKKKGAEDLLKELNKEGFVI